MHTLRVNVAVAVAVVASACATSPAKPPGQADSPEGNPVGAVAGRPPPSGDEADAPTPNVSCAALPAVADPPAGEDFTSNMNAGKQLVAFVAQPLPPPPDSADRETRLAWTKTCLKRWYRWKGGVLERADVAFVRAAQKTDARGDRVEATATSAEAWLRFMEQFMDTAVAAEPAEWRGDAKVNAAYVHALLEPATAVLDSRVGPPLNACVRHAGDDAALKQRCDVVRVRVEAFKKRGEL
jgi:hypothetical protein